MSAKCSNSAPMHSQKSSRKCLHSPDWHKWGVLLNVCWSNILQFLSSSSNSCCVGVYVSKDFMKFSSKWFSDFSTQRSHIQFLRLIVSMSGLKLNLKTKGIYFPVTLRCFFAWNLTATDVTKKHNQLVYLSYRLNKSRYK